MLFLWICSSVRPFIHIAAHISNLPPPWFTGNTKCLGTLLPDFIHNLKRPSRPLRQTDASSLQTTRLHCERQWQCCIAQSSLRRMWLAVNSIPDGLLRLLKPLLRSRRLTVMAETDGSRSELLRSDEDREGLFLTKRMINRSVWESVFLFRPEPTFLKRGKALSFHR